MNLELLIQQLITGLSNGMIIALIALGYTLVYGIVELINFAHGDLVMLGGFMALSVLGAFGLAAVEPGSVESVFGLVALLLVVPPFCGLLNWSVDRFAYRPIRNAPKLSLLVSAIGVSFVFINFGLFWGGLPFSVFGGGNSSAAPKDFPNILPNLNLMGESEIFVGPKEVLVFAISIPVLLLLTLWVKKSRYGKAMRAVAQDPVAARLMGIDVDKVVGLAFVVGGFLAGVASVVYVLYNNTVHFQMGYRVGMDAFTAAVLGGIGNMPGAMLGGLLIGVLRAFSDQFVATMWTNAIVFATLILVLVFRPSGILGANLRDKV